MSGLAFALLLTVLPAPGGASQALASPIAYTGTIPCADCPGIKVTLNLLTDGTYLLRQEYLERKSLFVDVGRWAIERGKLTLLGSGEKPDYFRVVSPTTIRKLDADGREIPGGQNFDLPRESTFRLIQDPAPLSGMFLNMADAAEVTLCQTGQKLAVATEGDSPALEKEYRSKRAATGAPLLARFTGHLVERPKVEGTGTRLVLVVDHFEKVSPDETCPPLKHFQTVRPGRTPVGQTWTLVSLTGQAVTPGAGQNAPSLFFDPGSHRITGSTGCNRLTGRYALDGDVVTFNYLVPGRRTCKEGNETETTFLRVLGDVTGWSLSGDRLTLYARKETVAEFVAKDE
ncbi:MAG: copper resistance protein NlpE N-terminal domain-containing protein [Thermoanaerobaculia bacterium]